MARIASAIACFSMAVWVVWQVWRLPPHEAHNLLIGLWGFEFVSLHSGALLSGVLANELTPSERARNFLFAFVVYGLLAFAAAKLAGLDLLIAYVFLMATRFMEFWGESVEQNWGRIKVRSMINVCMLLLPGFFVSWAYSLINFGVGEPSWSKESALMIGAGIFAVYFICLGLMEFLPERSALRLYAGVARLLEHRP